MLRAKVSPIPTLSHTTSVRWHSAPPTSTKVYDFDGVSSFNLHHIPSLLTSQVKSFTESPSADRIIIDVREPAEYENGFIPGAINIPISSNPDALLLPEDEFEDRFGFAKPAVDKEVVFYCKAGVRSSAAAQLAQQGGYKNIAEYRGSWMDWTKKGGKTEK